MIRNCQEFFITPLKNNFNKRPGCCDLLRNNNLVIEENLVSDNSDIYIIEIEFSGVQRT